MPNLSLFPEIEVFESAAPGKTLETVAGLVYCPHFIEEPEETALLRAVDLEPWSYQWQRRTQYYGERYVPRSSLVDQARAMPAWSRSVCQRLVEAGMMDRLPNQIGINEYLPGQGIAPHIDHMGGTVVSLSLGSDCVMEFTRAGSAYAYPLLLERRSAVVLQGDARDMWKHGISKRKTDFIDGRAFKRARRVSITFRDVMP